MRLKLSSAISAPLVICLWAAATAAAAFAQQPTTSAPAAAAAAQEAKPQQQQQQPVPAVAEWSDAFDGKSLDAERWERFTFEGGGGGKVEVGDGQLRMRGMNRSRAGVRSKRPFNSDRFIFEATIVKVGAPLPLPNERNVTPGNAILTVMFDGSGRNRIEWLLTSDGIFEAWAVIDGRGERLDNRSLGTKKKNPTLAIVRRGDEFLFMLNGQVGLQKTIKNMPRVFHAMLYGFGSSENNWDSVRVVTAK